MTNLEVTVVLEQEQVNALIAVADKEGTTLSALFRDIVASYLGEHAAIERACLWALHRHLQVDREESEQYDSKSITGIHQLQDEIASLRKLITDHLANHETEEHSFKPRSQQRIEAVLFEDESGVITSDPVAIDSTVLVKPTKPVAPVIEAPGYGSVPVIEDGKEYSVAEASTYLGLSLSTVRKYAQNGKISARKENKGYVFLEKDLRDYLAKG